MSKMIAAYEAYLSNWKAMHPNVLEPQVYDWNPLLNEPPLEAREFTSLRYVGEEGGPEVIHNSCRYWSDFGKVVRVPSGAVYEVLEKNMRTHVAIFQSLADWLAYETPMTIRQYHDQW